VLDAAHGALGPVGAMVPHSFTSTPSIDLQREAVRRLERAGWPEITAVLHQTYRSIASRQLIAELDHE